MTEEEMQEMFEGFFEGYYRKEVLDTFRSYPEKKSLEVDFGLLEGYDFRLAEELLNHPTEALEAARKALATFEPPLVGERVGLIPRWCNLPDTAGARINELRSSAIGRFLQVDGVVRKATAVKSRLVVGAFECLRCGHTNYVKQPEHDVLVKPRLCESCENKGPFELEENGSWWESLQKLLVQDPVEDLKGGESPGELAVYVEGEQAGSVNPGERVSVVGPLKVLKGQAKKNTTKATPVFRTYLEANNVTVQEKEFEDIEIGREDEEEILKFSEREDIYDALVSSIAPHVYGHRNIKEAVAYQLFSAPAHHMPGGGRFRGDSHILLLGEPATAKSEIIQYVARELSPKGLLVSGRGSSGAGLCVSPDTWVLTSSGPSRIGDYVEERLGEASQAEEVSPGFLRMELEGEKMLALDPISFRVGKRAEVRAVWRIDAPEKVARITTESGYELEVTPHTRVLSLERGVKVWRKAKELAVDDLIAVHDGCGKGAHWDGVRSVRHRVPEYGHVYDVTVDSHNFVANGVITHNTASAVKDEFGEGAWSLEAGALALADRGHVSADEFEKMAPEDRGHITNALEQQQTSIAKAGMVATFNTRCTLLAAANPKYGRFDDYKALSEQVALDPPILSVDHGEPVMVRDMGKIRTMKIGELVDRYYPEREEGHPIYPGDGLEVPAFNPDTFRIDWTPVRYVFRHEITEPLYKVDLESGRSVKLTRGHSVYVYENGEVTTKPTGKLSAGDYVVIPGRLPGADGKGAEKVNLIRELLKLPDDLTATVYLHDVPRRAFDRISDEIPPGRRYWINRRILPLRLAPLLTQEEQANCSIMNKGGGHAIPASIPLNAKLMRLLGYYMSDGSLTVSSSKSFMVSVTVNRKKVGIIEDLKAIYRELFNIEARVNQDGETKKVLVSDKTVFLFLDRILRISKGAKNKKVPEIVFNMPRELQHEFLIAYFRGDRGVTASENLISDVLYLLLQSEIVGHQWGPKKYTATFPDGHRAVSESYVLTSPSPYKGEISKGKDRLQMVPYKQAAGIIEKILTARYEGGPGKCHEDPRLGARLRGELLSRKLVSTRLERLELLRDPLTIDGATELFEDISRPEHARQYLQKLTEKGLVEKERISGNGEGRFRTYRYSLSEEGERLLKGIRMLDKLDSGDLAFARVKSVEPAEPTSRYVYDLSTPGRENFVAGLGGVMCHNSRFDLIFFVKDDLSKTREVTRHILKSASRPEEVTPPVEPEFLKKYVAYARQKVAPVLDEGAEKTIEDFYVDTREKVSETEDSPMPMTARQLWAAIRLAKARARARLSEVATKEDAEAAVRLIRESLKQAGMDLETGEVDIDRLYSDTPKSQRDRYKAVLQIIATLEDESPNGRAKKEEIIKEAGKKSMNTAEVEEALNRLKKEGDIFEPKFEQYKVT